MNKPKQVTLYGRVIISGTIQALTGLHIGRGKEGISIGGVDNAVIRNTINNEPYIPGSSLKGKLRSLAEKKGPNLPMDQPKNSDVQLHYCTTAEAYRTCPVCRIYGVPGDQPASAPTRLIVRDVRLTETSKKHLDGIETDLPYTEIKYEAAIDRVTSKAKPRPLERVPAESEFGPFEMVFNIYEEEDCQLLAKLFETMRALEDDYLGGSGSRGSGKIKFKDLTITVKPVEVYAGTKAPEAQGAKDLDDLFAKLSSITNFVKKNIPVSAQPKE